MSLLLMMFITWILASGSLAHPLPDDEDSVDVNENLLEAHFSELSEVIFGLPKKETGEKVSQWHPQMEVNPEELGEYLEGDILFPETITRNGLKAESSRWPKGIVYYTLSSYFSYKDREMILSAMDEYHNHTCIKFVQYSGAEPDYIRFVSGNTGCWSSVGRTGGGQDLNLQSPGCLTKKGTAMHEMMHALGFYHEHTRWERDNHVTIHYENIQQGRENNFQKSSKQTTDALGVNYDYRSVMHYSGFAFSANNNPTIESKSLHLKWNASLQKLTVSVKSQVDFAGAVRLDGFPSFLKSIAPRQYSITPTHRDCENPT